jgi:hypothetical protein
MTKPPKNRSPRPWRADASLLTWRAAPLSMSAGSDPLPRSAALLAALRAPRATTLHIAKTDHERTPRSATRAIFPAFGQLPKPRRQRCSLTSMERFQPLGKANTGIANARDAVVLGVSTCVCTNEKSCLPEKTAVFCLKGPDAPVTRREPALRILPRSVMSDFRVTHRAVGGMLFSGTPSSGELLIEIHLSMGGVMRRSPNSSETLF